jgi:hypothetical protein
MPLANRKCERGGVWQEVQVALGRNTSGCFHRELQVPKCQWEV